MWITLRGLGTGETDLTAEQYQRSAVIERAIAAHGRAVDLAASQSSALARQAQLDDAQQVHTRLYTTISRSELPPRLVDYHLSNLQTIRGRLSTAMGIRTREHAEFQAGVMRAEGVYTAIIDKLGLRPLAYAAGAEEIKETPRQVQEAYRKAQSELPSASNIPWKAILLVAGSLVALRIVRVL